MGIGCDKSPTISVIMGVYNQKENIHSVKRAIDSILQQTFSDFEFLICENGSDPEIIFLLHEFEEKDSRISFIDGTGAEKLSKKLNRCLNYAKGEFIARMDDDDFSYPERFEKQLQYLKENPNIAFVGCNVNQRFTDADNSCRFFPENPTVHDFLFVQPFIHPTLLFQSESLVSIGGYCEESWCDRCEDYEMLLRMYEHSFKGANLQEILFEYSADILGNRKLVHRFNETKTRWVRFTALKLLPNKILFVIKPIFVYFIPHPVVTLLKNIL